MSLIERAKANLLRGAARVLFAHERLTTGAVYNPLARRSQEDPYPMYRRLRERDPIHRSRLVEGWVLSRYEDVLGVLRDPRFSADERNSKGFDRDRERRIKSGLMSEDEEYNPSMLRLDPPDHTRLRGLVSKAFTPRAIERLRPRVEAIVDEQLDAVADHDQIDLIEDLGYPVPVTVIAEMMGVPPEDRAQFKYWSDEVVRGLGFSSAEDDRRSEAGSRQLERYLEEIIEKRRTEPRDDLISGLVAAEEHGDRLTTQEIYSTCSLLLVAGNETTTNLIGNGMLALLRHPDQLELLRSEPDRIERAVSELLRYDGPVQATSRLAKEAVRMRDGTQVEKGDQLIVLIGSANRDPDVFSNPDRLDITQARDRHLGFGIGTHFCLGSQLAQLEGQVAITRLLERFGRLELAVERPDWGDNTILRGLRSLPVRAARA